METFEYKAPMYVNFGETSVLQENDGADRFFDCDDDSDTKTGIKLEEPENLQTDSSVGCESQDTRVKVEDDDSDVTGTPPDERTDEILDQALRNLRLAKHGKVKIHKEHRAENGRSGPMRVMRNEMNGTLYGKTEKAQSKFVSMAEAIRKFQVGTPDRFHTKPKSSRLNSSLDSKKNCFTIKPNTIPLTPQLTSHLRSRPVHYLTREEEEEKIAEEMKEHRIKANPLNPKVLEPPKQAVKVERKAPTIPVPFNLTEVKKKMPDASPAFVFTARPAPGKILEKTVGVPVKKDLPLTQPVSPACLKRSKVYATCIEVKDGVKCITEKEVHHFGVPVAEWKRTTEVKPFSFEERDKELLRRRKEAVEKYLEQEKKGREFHANPLPSSNKSPNHQKHKSIVPTEPVPFQFLVDKRGMSKQELLKQKLEEEEQQLQQLAKFKARPATIIQKKPFEPKKSDRPLTDITGIELNTEKRAKEREEFDMKVKQEQARLDEFRRLRNEEMKRKEEEEVARLRKEAVHKAKAAPHFKPFMISSSDKPLTEPKSPMFSCRSRIDSESSHSS